MEVRSGSRWYRAVKRTVCVDAATPSSHVMFRVHSLYFTHEASSGKRWLPVDGDWMLSLSHVLRFSIHQTSRWKGMFVSRVSDQ